MVLIAEQEPVLPVLLVLVPYRLLYVPVYHSLLRHLHIFHLLLLFIFLLELLVRLALVEQQIRVAPLHALHQHRRVVALEHVFAPEALLRDVVGVEVSHDGVVHLVPLVALPDERVVVAGVRSARVHHHAFQLVLVVLLRVWQLLLLLRRLLFPAEPLLSEVLHVQVERELAVVVHFDPDHAVVVELEPPQSYHQVLRQLLNARPFQRIHLLVALLAVVRVVALQHLALDQRIQPLLYRLLVLHRHTQRQIRLLSFKEVGTTLAYHLRCKFTPKVLLYSMLLRGTFDCGFDSVHEHVEELFTVHLLVHIGRLSFVVLERVAEPLGTHVLLLGFKQPREYQLQLVQHVLFLIHVLVLFDSQDVVSQRFDHK